MIWKSVDLEEVLNRSRQRAEGQSGEAVLNSYRQMLDKEDQEDEEALNTLSKRGNAFNEVEEAQLDPRRIYREEEIKAICINYRLRFLDAALFKGHIPYEAVTKVKRLRRRHGEALQGFKIVAPAPMFHLENKDKDPLLFMPLSNGQYYLVHKWGGDLHPLRRLMVWPFKSFKTLIGTVALFALAIVMCIPDSVIMGPYDQSSASLRVIFFIYLFIAFSGLTALYGFSRVKNFNTALWQSKYLD